MTFENLNLVGVAPLLNQEPPPLARVLIAGAGTLVRRVVADGEIDLACPSLAVDNATFVRPSGAGCVITNFLTSIIGAVP